MVLTRKLLNFFISLAYIKGALLSLFLCTPILGIVPKPGISIEKYEQAAANMHNVGQLEVFGEKITRCSATLISTDDNIGIVLTAGHCADFSPQELVNKCRYKTVSFSPKDAPPEEKFPVIGRFALSKYIDLSTDYENDIGLLFIDLTDAPIRPTPRKIQLDKTKVPKNSLVYVAGYGKTGILDDLQNPIRRAMATQATLTRKNNHDVLMLDETAIENTPTLVPVGDHPDQGDSGGPVIDAKTGEVLGVVSHTAGSNFYSESVFAHAAWLLDQIKHAGRYFVFSPKKSGKFSQSSTWEGGHKPLNFTNAYGEINPIIKLTDQQILTLDDTSDIYAVDIEGKGGTLQIETPYQHIEVLRASAPLIITSQNENTLITDDFKVATSDVSLETPLHILHQMHIGRGAIFKANKTDPEKGLTIIDRGSVKIDGILETHHVHFSPAKTESLKEMGHLYLSGTLKSDMPLLHTAHVIEAQASSPGRIQSDYILDNQGILRFNIDTSSVSSAPILSIEGIVHLTGGIITLTGQEILPLGYEQTLLSASSLDSNLNWEGRYSTNLVEDDTEILFVTRENKLKMKVIPLNGSSAPLKGEALDIRSGKIF